MVSPDLAKSIVEPWLYALNTGDAEQLLALSKDTEEIRSVWLEKCDSASVKSYGEKRPCGSSSDGGVKNTVPCATRFSAHKAVRGFYEPCHPLQDS